MKPDHIHHALWRASDEAPRTHRRLTRAHEALAPWLPGHGWPLGELTEILLDRPGSGELTLLAPALAALPEEGAIVLLHPPLVPNLVAWEHWKIDTGRLCWIEPAQEHDIVWSAQQVLDSQSVSALLCWSSQADAQQLRRLHLSARQGAALFVVFRPRHCAAQFSPAPLRLEITQSTSHGPGVRLLKSRGPKPARQIPLPLPVGQHSPAGTLSPGRLSHNASARVAS